MKTILFAAALALPGIAIAQTAAQPVTVTNSAFVVRQMTDANGKVKNTLAPTDRVVPGDALVFRHEYKNSGAKPVTAFAINNPIPANVEYTGVEQSWAVVSIDGGKSFAPLATLKVKKPDGTMRAAIPQDVTAVRWTFAQPIPAGGSGKVEFYAVVK